MWNLAAVDYFKNRIEVSLLEDMTTGSVTSALHEIMALQGWKTKQISLDTELSLHPAVKRTSEELGQLDTEESAQGGEELEPGQAAALVTGF